MKELKEIKNITDKFVKKADKFIESQKEPKLKRCPFCGGKPVLLPDNTVECMTTDCPMHPDYIMPIENWNNRRKIKSVLKEYNHQYYKKITKVKRKAAKTALEQKNHFANASKKVEQKEHFADVSKTIEQKDK